MNWAPTKPQKNYIVGSEFFGHFDKVHKDLKQETKQRSIEEAEWLELLIWDPQKRNKKCGYRYFIPQPIRSGCPIASALVTFSHLHL